MTSAILLALALGSLAPARSAAAAADPACHEHSDGTQTCVTALSVSGSVDSATGGTVTVTASATSTHGALDSLGISYDLPSEDVSTFLRPLPDRPGTFRGELEVPAGTTVGSFPAQRLSGYAGDGGLPADYWVIGRAELVAAGLPGTLTITGTPDTTGPVLRSLSVSATQVDTTMGDGTVAVEARVTDDHAGATWVSVDARYQRAPDAHPASYPSYSSGVRLTLVSGTATDGIWRGELEVSGGTRGTWPLSVYLADRWDNESGVGSDELAAAGLPSVLRSDTTAPPTRPTLTGRTWIHTECCYPVVVDGVVNWTQPQGTPAVSGVVLESYSPACGTPPNWRPIYPWDREIVFENRTLLVPCTVTMHMVNAAGASPPGSVTFW